MSTDNPSRVLPAFADAALGEPLQRLSESGWRQVEAAQDRTLDQIADLQARQETTLLNDTVIEMGAILRQQQAPAPHLRPSWADGRQAAGNLLDQAMQNVETRNRAAVGRLERAFEETVRRTLVTEGLAKPRAVERTAPSLGGWKRMREAFNERGDDREHDR